MNSFCTSVRFLACKCLTLAHWMEPKGSVLISKVLPGAGGM